MNFSVVIYNVSVASLHNTMAIHYTGVGYIYPVGIYSGHGTLTIARCCHNGGKLPTA